MITRVTENELLLYNPFVFKHKLIRNQFIVKL